MKKYYCITILALLVVTLLQGYNVFAIQGIYL